MSIRERIVHSFRNGFLKLGLFPLLLIALSSFGISAILQPGFIDNNDSLFHLHRIIVFDQALREGDIYPRWFPEFALGYGYPLLNFYAPLSYYVAEFFHLTGFGLSTAEKLTFATSLVLSGLTMYLWMTEVYSSRQAGFLAAISYMYFPYRMADIYVRGALAECVAFVFLPLLLWSTFKLLVKGSKIHLFSSSVILALLVLTHNITALFFVPIWLAYAFLLVLFAPGSNLQEVRNVARKTFSIIASLISGLALSSFYWLPALQEQVYASTSVFKDVGSDPLTQISAYGDLIQTTWVYNYLQLPQRIGFVQLLAFVIGTFALLFLLVLRNHVSVPARLYVLHGLFFLVVAVADLVMISPAGIPVWETVPLIDNIQFPWRLLGFVGLGTAVLSGLLGMTRKSFLFLGLPLAALLCFSSTSSMQILYTYLNEADLNITEAARYEFNSGVFGGTASAEYLPVWARAGFRIPREDPAVRAGEKEKPASNLDVTVQEFKREDYKLTVTSEEGGPLRLHQFYFPGWQARLDGKAVNTYPSTLLGLVTMDVPAGEHSVEVFFGDSNVRYYTRILSILALLGLAAAYLLTIRRVRRTMHFSVPVLSIAAVAFYFNVGMTGMPQKVAGTELPAYAFKSEQLELKTLRLSGFGLDTRRASADGKVKVDLFWQSLGGKEDSFVSLNIKDAEGKVVGNRVTRPIFGTGMTYLWNTDELVRDEEFVPIETPIQPGRYTLEVSTKGGLDTLASAELGTFSLPEIGVSQNIPSTMKPVGKTFGGKVELLGTTTVVNGKELEDEREALAPGDTIELTLYWRVLKDMTQDYTVFLHLLDTNGVRVTQKDTQPGAGFRPTSQWLIGDLVEDRHVLYVPSTASGGMYRVQMGLYYLNTMERLPIDGQSENNLTLRQFKIVPTGQEELVPARPLDGLLGGAMRLTGATVGSPGITDSQLVVKPDSDFTLPVTLFWHTEKEMEEDYTVFIHVVDASGKVVAQVDGQPMKGAYPTSFWSAGEDIPDGYDIILHGLPPGDYQLRAGAYLRKTMTRLTTDSGQDSIVIGGLKVTEK